MPDVDGRRRLHPLAPLVDGVRVLPSFAFALVLGAGGRWTLVVMVLGLAVVAGAVRYLEWSRFTYGIAGRELVVESGLVQRNRRVVPLDRVQQVDLQRKVQHRVFGLAVVRIDTAGGGRDAEVVLDAVSDAEAERLRSLLRSFPSAARPEVVAAVPVPDVVVEGPERDVVALRPGLLALGGITGGRLLVMLAVVGSFAGFVLDVSPDAVERSIDAARETRPTVVTAVLIALGTLPLWFGAAAASAVLTDGGYRLSRRGDHLHLRRGMLDQRESTLLVHRVQAVHIRQNPVRRALGLVAVTLQSAGGSHGADGAESNVAIPVLRSGDLPQVLAEVLPIDPDAGPLRPAPPAARRRALVRHLVPTVLLVGALWVAGLLLADPSGSVRRAGRRRHGRAPRPRAGVGRAELRRSRLGRDPRAGGDPSGRLDPRDVAGAGGEGAEHPAGVLTVPASGRAGLALHRRRRARGDADRRRRRRRGPRRPPAPGPRLDRGPRRRGRGAPPRRGRRGGPAGLNAGAKRARGG